MLYVYVYGTICKWIWMETSLSNLLHIHGYYPPMLVHVLEAPHCVTSLAQLGSPQTTCKPNHLVTIVISANALPRLPS
jgi:hypothetical protein